MITRRNNDGEINCNLYVYLTDTECLHFKSRFLRSEPKDRIHVHELVSVDYGCCTGDAVFGGAGWLRLLEWNGIEIMGLNPLMVVSNLRPIHSLSFSVI